METESTKKAMETLEIRRFLQLEELEILENQKLKRSLMIYELQYFVRVNQTNKSMGTFYNNMIKELKKDNVEFAEHTSNFVSCIQNKVLGLRIRLVLVTFFRSLFI